MMSIYLRVDADSGLAIEAWDSPDGKNPSDCFVDDLAQTFIKATDDAAVGWTYAGKWIAPVSAVPLAPVPIDISRRQFYEQLALDGDITEDEALEAAAGIALPRVISDAIATLPKEQQFPAKMLLRTAASFERSHPLVSVFGLLLKKDSEALDKLWTAASAL